MNYSLPSNTPASSAAAGAALGGLLVIWLIILIVAIITIIGMWKIFTKAGKPGWAAIVPIYNVVVLMQVVGRPLWWVILFLIPFVNIIISLLVAIDLAKSFGKDAVYGVVALWLFSFVGYIMLGFGQAQYVGPAAAGSAGAGTPPATPQTPPAAPPASPQTPTPTA